MKDSNKEKDEELVDIDETGNPIEKEKEKEEKKIQSKAKYKIALSIIVFIVIIISCYFFLNLKKKNKSVFDETTLKNLKLKKTEYFSVQFHILLKK